MYNLSWSQEKMILTLKIAGNNAQGDRRMVFSLGNPNCLNADRYSNAGTEE